MSQAASPPSLPPAKDAPLKEGISVGDFYSKFAQQHGDLLAAMGQVD
jgi:hypothetical protein